MSRRRPRRSRARTPAIRPPCTLSASTVWPTRKRTPRLSRCTIHGSIHASFVGASSTRSGAPSLPRPMMFMMQASAMLPILRVPAVAREAHARRHREVVPDAVGVPGERDPPHRVGDVVIEAREEAEAMLAGQVPPPVARRPGDGDRACLAAERLALVDGDVEA